MGLEAWLLAVAVATAKPAQDSGVPPLELLEFIGGWTVEEMNLIDQAAPKKKPAKPRKKKDVVNEADETRSGPPR